MIKCVPETVCFLIINAFKAIFHAKNESFYFDMIADFFKTFFVKKIK